MNKELRRMINFGEEVVIAGGLFVAWLKMEFDLRRKGADRWLEERPKGGVYEGPIEDEHKQYHPTWEEVRAQVRGDFY